MKRFVNLNGFLALITIGYVEVGAATLSNGGATGIKTSVSPPPPHNWLC